MDVRQEMLAALSVIGEGEKGRALFAFLPEAEQEPLDRLATRFLREEGKANGREIAQRIRKLGELARWSGLEEIHPGWIFEALADESPRILGLLCRFLSGEKARYILNRLPPSVRAKVPGLTQSFAVSREILDVVRLLIEKKLGLTPPPRAGAFTFAHIGWMKGEDLRILFRELGLEEIRRAFFETDSQVLRTFLSRFAPSQAREIREKIERSARVTQAVKEQAQLHLVSLSLTTLPPEDLFREIGFSFFARALMPGEEDLVRRIGQRLAPEEGYRLLRVAQETEKKTEEIPSRRETILSIIFSLGERRKIGRYWQEEPEGEITKSERAA